MSTARRDPYAEVGARMRSLIARACPAGLSARELRTLLAVLSLTAGWSKFSDRTYLANIATIVYGIAEVEGWHCKKVGRDLLRLHDLGLIERVAPGPGRPGDGPRYVVGLPAGVSAEFGDNDANGSSSGPIESDKEPDPAPEWVQPRPPNGSSPGTPTEDSPRTQPRGAVDNVDPLLSIIESPTDETVAEFTAVLEQFADQHGKQRAGLALAAMAGRRFAWASRFRKAIAAWHIDNPPAPAWTADDNCKDCGGTGWAGGTTVEPCECRTRNRQGAA